MIFRLIFSILVGFISQVFFSFPSFAQIWRINLPLICRSMFKSHVEEAECVLKPSEADLSYPPPKGVLRLLVKSGSGLRAADLTLTGASSDPYVVIEVLHRRFFWIPPME